MQSYSIEILTENMEEDGQHEAFEPVHGSNGHDKQIDQRFHLFIGFKAVQLGPDSLFFIVFGMKNPQLSFDRGTKSRYMCISLHALKSYTFRSGSKQISEKCHQKRSSYWIPIANTPLPLRKGLYQKYTQHNYTSRSTRITRKPMNPSTRLKAAIWTFRSWMMSWSRWT